MNFLIRFFSIILLFQFLAIYPYIFEARSYTAQNSQQKVVVYYDAHVYMEYPIPTESQKAEFKKQRDAFVKKIQNTEGVTVLVEDIAIPSTYHPVGEGRILSFRDLSDWCNDLTSSVGYEFLCGLAKQLSHKGIGVEKRHYICRSGSNFDRFEPSVTNAHLNSIIKRSVLEAYMKCHAERDHFIWKILNGFLAELEESIIYQELNNASPSHPAVVTLKKVGEEACSIGLAPIEDMHLVSHMYDLLYNQNAKLVAVCAGSYHADSVSQVLEILGFTLEQKLGDVKQVKNLLDSSCFDLINNEMIPA